MSRALALALVECVDTAEPVTTQLNAIIDGIVVIDALEERILQLEERNGQ
jgi:hypothetical protein